MIKIDVELNKELATQTSVIVPFVIKSNNEKQTSIHWNKHLSHVEFGIGVSEAFIANIPFIINGQKDTLSNWVESFVIDNGLG